MSKVDLHLHTNLSDGLISPEDVVIKAKNNDCKIISITDHELLNEDRKSTHLNSSHAR